jgi:hypothetical protein
MREKIAFSWAVEYLQKAAKTPQQCREKIF